MTLRRARLYWAGKGGGGLPFPITDNSFDAFGILRHYEGNEDSFLIESDSVKDVFGYVGSEADINSIESFIGANTGVVESFYPQKKTNAEIRFENSTSRPFYDENTLPNNKPSINFDSSSRIFIEGSLSDNISKNTNAFVFTCLIKGNDTIGSTYGNIIYISTASSTQRVRVSVQINDSGFQLQGRRVSADNIISISAIYSTKEWNVVTGIFDYQNRELILRVNGVQEAINDNFQSGGNSENTNALRKIISGGGTISGDSIDSKLAGITIWNQSINISEIETIENRYITYAGIS